MSNLEINIPKLIQFVESYPNVQFAYLFGSYARKEARESSDVDIACYLDEALNASQRSNVSLDLTNGIMAAIGKEKVDVVILNDAPLELRYAVVYDGIIISDQQKEERVAFEVKTMSLFLDRQYYIKRNIEMNLNRIAVEGIL